MSEQESGQVSEQESGQVSEQEKEAIEYFEDKIKNKMPLYEETYVDGKPYRIDILQLETNFTEEQANKTQVILNLIEKLQKENQQLKDDQLWSEATIEWLKERFIPKERIENKIKYLDSIDEYNAPNGWELEREYARDILKELLGE